MMDVNTWILLALTLGALVFAYARRPSLAADGLLAGGRLLRNVAPELVLGFALAGLVDVLVPSATMVRWLGAETTLSSPENASRVAFSSTVCQNRSSRIALTSAGI